jgi:hypothetical protein
MKTCLLLYWNAIFNFRKLLQLVWSHLNLKYKIYEANKKNRKREKKKKKRVKGRGNQFSPAPQMAHGPPGAKPERVSPHPRFPADRRAPLVKTSSPADWSDPLVSTIFFPGPKIPPETETSPLNSPLQYAFTPCRFFPAPAPISSPRSPLAFPSTFPCNSTARLRRLHARVRSLRHCSTPIPAHPRYLETPFLVYASPHVLPHLLMFSFAQIAQ